MQNSIVRTLIALVVIGGAVAAFFMVRQMQEATVKKPLTPSREAPPTADELRDQLTGALESFEAHRDLALGLASPSAGLQADFFAWGGDEQRTEMHPGKWWAPGETWYDTAAVLEAVGLDEEAFARLKAFLGREGLLAIQKIQGSHDNEAEVHFLSRRGHDNMLLERVLVWHADPTPRTARSTALFSEEKRYPQQMRETALSAEGWFVRETIVDRPR